MKLYRAMCQQEYVNTLKSGKPDFVKRFKWFATNLQFIENRVKDGKFNNSNHVKNRYDFVLEFDADIEKADFVSNNEVQFDRRRNPKIILLGEVKL